MGNNIYKNIKAYTCRSQKNSSKAKQESIVEGVSERNKSRRPAGRFIGVIAAALILVAGFAIWAIASQTNVAYDKYAPVTIKETIPESALEDNWFTLQFKDTTTSETYRQAIKIEAGQTSAEVKVGRLQN